MATSRQWRVLWSDFNVTGWIMLRSTLIGLVIAISSNAAHSDSCGNPQYACAEYGTKWVEGLKIDNACLSVIRTESCTRSEPEDTCRRLSPQTVPQNLPLGDGQCHRTARDCVRYEAGQCNRYRERYRCWNGPVDAAPASLLSRKYHNFIDRIVNDCQSVAGDANCRLEETSTVQAASTRSINTMSVTRSWWEKQRRYDCTNNNYTDDCDRYDGNPICRESGSTCIDYAEDGSCQYAEYRFDCDADASFNANCEPINVCVGDNCQGIEQEVNTDYPRVAAWLNFLDEAAKDSDCDAKAGADPNAPSTSDCVDQEKKDCRPDTSDPRYLLGHSVPLVCAERVVQPTQPDVFGGRQMWCSYNGIISCCNDGGWNACRSVEKEVRSYVKAGATHYKQTVCSRRFFGFCVMRRRYYCAYNGKFARVFQEQANLQTGTQFPSRHAADPCPALTINQLRELDVGRMDLSEVFGDMMEQAKEPVQDLVIDRLRSQMGVVRTDVEQVFE